MVNRIIEAITKCLICGKSITVAPIDSNANVPQYQLRCKKHHKQLKKTWPVNYDSWWNIVKDGH